MLSEWKDGSIILLTFLPPVSFMSLPALARLSSVMLKRSRLGYVLAFFLA
jgi:hypothetical protein